MKLVDFAKNAILNIPGWKTRRKILVIESDDWGSIRSNKSSHFSLLQSGAPIENDLYSRFDKLESENDLNHLFEVLSKFKDFNGKNLVFTANTVMGNPDFEKIESANFEKYYWEYFTDTLSKEYPNKNVNSLWFQGVDNGFFKPQFHGREHINVASWLKDLKSNNKFALLAFYNKSFCYPVSLSGKRKRKNHMASFDFSGPEQKRKVLAAIEEGLLAFKDVFKFSSDTIIAPCYVWSRDVESLTSHYGVTGIQGIRFQYHPSQAKHYKRRIHFTGQKNTFNQRYLVRNAFYEPTHFGVSKCIKSIIDRAKLFFLLGIPLIIGSHRVNFMGGMDEKNRDANINGLDKLIKELLINFPDIEFFSTNDLLRLINTKG